MKKQLAKLLSLLCVLALATGCLAGAALAEDTPKESRIITVEWLDNNNEDGLRPDSRTATLNNTPVTLNSGNGWTGEVLVPGVLEAGAIDKTDGCAQAAALAEKI